MTTNSLLCLPFFPFRFHYRSRRGCLLRSPWSSEWTCLSSHPLSASISVESSFRMHGSTCSVSLKVTRLAQPVRLLFISSGGEYSLRFFLFFFPLFLFYTDAEVKACLRRAKMKLASPPALHLLGETKTYISYELRSRTRVHICKRGGVLAHKFPLSPPFRPLIDSSVD